MPDGPLTEEMTAQVEWARIWSSLPEEMRAGLAQLEAAHPGEVLAAVSGGVIAAVPEGKDVADWMGELATAGGFGGLDTEARNFSLTTYWLDPVRPAPNATFKVGFQVSSQNPIEEPYDVSVTVLDGGQNIVQLVNKTIADGSTDGELEVPGLEDAGLYVVNGYVNSGGVDPGSEAGPEGYRTPFQFQFQVGDFTANEDESLTWEGMDQLGAQLNTLATQLMSSESIEDFAPLAASALRDLESAPPYAESWGDLEEVAKKLDDPQYLFFTKGAVAGAADALSQVAGQVLAIRISDPAGYGVFTAYVDQFVAKVNDVITRQ